MQISYKYCVCYDIGVTMGRGVGILRDGIFDWLPEIHKLQKAKVPDDNRRLLH